MGKKADKSLDRDIDIMRDVYMTRAQREACERMVAELRRVQESPVVVVTEAATAWWCGHRPVGWTEAQHRENPEVNCPTDAEMALARAVAALQPDSGSNK